ncbi:MAG: Ig-like domain-containing protein [Bacillota bacterium]
MAEKSNYRIVLVIILGAFLPLLFMDCANQLPPGGGQVDTTPPEIVGTYPENGAISFSDNHIEIEFSEYVEKRTFQEALFISPAFQGQMEFEWSGHSVRVNFPEKLKENITYVVTIGTDVVDLNNKNRLAQAYSFSFSSGNKIDRGVAYGKVYSNTPSGIMLFAYSLDSLNINPSTVKPKYISQTGKQGEYSLRGLAFGKYRIFAIKDEYRDLIYDIGTDSYGSPFRDVELSEKDSLVKGLDFFLTREDTAKPRLLSAAMTDRYHLLVSYSEPVDSTLYLSKNFVLIDSTLNKTIQPVFAFQGRGKRNEMVLAIKENLSEPNNIFLFAKELRDLSGNSTGDDYTRITVTDKPDTSAPLIIKTIPPDRASGVETMHPRISFFFDDGFDSLRVRSSAISIADRSGVRYPFSISFIDDASFNINILADLKPRQDYYITLPLNSFTDVAGNKIDSVYKYSFTTFTGTDFSGVSGTVVPASDMSPKNIIVVLQDAENARRIYKKKTGEKLDFDFSRVEPGKYIIWSFQSRDSSVNYNYGKPWPFKPADRFTVSPDTLNLRARWPVSDVTVSY